MSADLLREAAAKMRERAEAATAGPWVAQDTLVVSDPGPCAKYVADCFDEPVGSESDARHIATFATPAVALAVADWLENVARFIPVVGAPDESFIADAWMTSWGDAINVARAYLGASDD